MKPNRLLPLLLGLTLLVSCRGPSPAPPQPPSSPSSRVAPPPPQAQALILVEAKPEEAQEDPEARTLELLLAHFDARCDIAAASSYRSGQVNRYRYAFYLAGANGEDSSRGFAADLADFEGIAVWVGPGLERVGEATLAQMGLSAASGGEPPVEKTWTISYRGQEHRERAALPEVVAEGAQVLAPARHSGRKRVFAAGKGKRWYVAAGPSFSPEHFWSACIWADALHDMLGISHEPRRRLIPVLRDVPVWATKEQVPRVLKPMMAAGLPVAVLAHTQMQDTPLADRPEDVKGLRAAEKMGATVVLWADGAVNARDHLHFAWEVGLHPVAWGGREGTDNPFRLRIADKSSSPPFSAGGLLPAPIAVTDAGYYSQSDLDRLHMQSVVRDAVALVSFGLWAPRDPFLKFVKARAREGWRTADLRELRVKVEDPRRVMVSGTSSVTVPWRADTRERVLGPRWEQSGQKTVSGGAEVEASAPDRSVLVLEPVRNRKKIPLLKGVNLDPWPYAWQGVSAKVLARSLAERYARNGVNTVFFYAYNVKEGAAYWTRYPGATISSWGKQDLLKEVIKACHARGIRVVAWMYSGRDRGMWTKHPSWRERKRDGSVYNPLRLHATYFLCPNNPEVREWYVGLVRDLAKRYPELDGIELAEPVVNWFGNTACYCDVCNREFRSRYPNDPLGGEQWLKWRAEGLTEFLSECIKAIKEEGTEAYLLTICDAWSNGAVLTPVRQAEESGLDLDALLDSPNPPDWINFEVIWQQWAAIYGTRIFNYQWAADTAQRLKNRVDGRARTVIHVEITDFGNQHMTAEKTAKTIRYVMRAKPDGVECYHSAALDRKSAWTVLRRCYEEIK